MTSHISKGKTGFQLPPEVSFEQQRLSHAWRMSSAIVWLFQTSGRLGIRSTKAAVNASLSAIRHFLRWFEFRPAVNPASDRRFRRH